MSIKYTDSNSASCFGVIGGADDFSIILTLEKEEDTFLSIPSFEKQDIYKFILEGINIKVCDSEEYEFRLR